MKLLEAQQLSPHLSDPGKRNPLPLAKKEPLHASTGRRRDEMQIILCEYPFDQARRKKSGLQAIQRLASLYQGLRPTLCSGFRSARKEIEYEKKSHSKRKKENQLNHDPAAFLKRPRILPSTVLVHLARES